MMFKGEHVRLIENNDILDSNLCQKHFEFEMVQSRRKGLFGERNYTLADKGRPLSIWETRLTRFQLSISKLKLKSELAGLDLS